MVHATEETNKLKKCIRKGDIIHYSNPENINMVKTGASFTKSSTGTAEMDKVSSGESLYKTFTFEQSTNDDETEKCIAFWKCVVEKNLQHIKCAFIENKKKVMSIPEEPLADLEFESQEKVEKRIKKVHEEYAKMWQTAWREIQKQKLQDVKLIGKARCKLCETVSSTVDGPKSTPRKGDIKKEIKALDNWTSKSKKKKIGERDVPVKTKVGDVEEPDKFKMTSWATISKTDENAYEFKNIIEEKKKNGDYSAWRENKLACSCNYPSCTCAKNPAIINYEHPQESTKLDFPKVSTTVTIENTIETTDVPETSSAEGVDVSINVEESPVEFSEATEEISEDYTAVPMVSPTSLEFAKTNNKIQPETTERSSVINMPKKTVSILKNKPIEHVPTSTSSDESKTSPSLLDFLTNLKALKRSISLNIKNCECTYSNCDCYNIEVPEKNDSIDDEIPPPPIELLQSAGFRMKRNSIMVHRRSLFEKQSSEALMSNKSSDEEPIEVIFPIYHND